MRVRISTAQQGPRTLRVWSTEGQRSSVELQRLSRIFRTCNRTVALSLRESPLDYLFGVSGLRRSGKPCGPDAPESVFCAAGWPVVTSRAFFRISSVLSLRGSGVVGAACGVLVLAAFSSSSWAAAVLSKPDTSALRQCPESLFRTVSNTSPLPAGRLIRHRV